MPKPNYDTTIARVAGNILSGMFIEDANDDKCECFVRKSVALARAIVAEVKRTEPALPTAEATICCCHVESSGNYTINRMCPIHGTHGIVNRNAKAPSRSIEG